MDWQSAPWLVWLGAALVAGLVELVSLDFFFLMLAGGAVAASLAAGAGAPPALQVFVFALASAGLIGGVRPPLKRRMEREPLELTGAAALVGQPARVLETVTDRAGRVKLAGEVWTARAAPGHTALEVGSDVHVVRIDGATAVVAPQDAPPHTHFLEGRTP